MLEKITVPEIRKRKGTDKKIAALTAYDYPFARILDEAGIEILLVGDSLGAVIQGQENTLTVTVDEMVYHTRAVVRGRKRAMVITDMPFLSFQVSIEDAKRNAGRIVKEGGAEAVKLEGGVEMALTIRAIVEAGIPVMAHVGLTPQRIHQFGGYRVQGKEKFQRESIIRDALAVENAGAFSVVLEGIPMSLAKEITERLSIPTIGIGAGVHCDGQVLVIHDMLGLFDRYTPKFVKQYADLRTSITDAVRSYVTDVQEQLFPGEEQTFH